MSHRRFALAFTSLYTAMLAVYFTPHDAVNAGACAFGVVGSYFFALGLAGMVTAHAR